MSFTDKVQSTKTPEVIDDDSDEVDFPTEYERYRTRVELLKEIIDKDELDNGTFSLSKIEKYTQLAIDAEHALYHGKDLTPPTE